VLDKLRKMNSLELFSQANSPHHVIVSNTKDSSFRSADKRPNLKERRLRALTTNLSLSPHSNYGLSELRLNRLSVDSPLKSAK
jgi:hypothetical protein